MTKERVLKVCDLHKQGFCTIKKAGTMVEVQGLVNGNLCKGKACEDFDHKYICSAFPITKL